MTDAVDDESSLVHSVVGTAASVADATQVDKLLHGEENMVGADADYTGVEKRPEHDGRRLFGRWRRAAASTRHSISAAFCTKPNARSRRLGPGAS